MEIELLNFVLRYQNLLGPSNRGSDSWDGPGEKIFVDYRHRESNLSAPFFGCAGTEAVPFQQHPYKPIMPSSAVCEGIPGSAH